MKAILIVSDRDNVATTLEGLDVGRAIDARGVLLTVHDVIPRGHKIAIRRILAGEPVVKYGSPIGTAIADIEPGSHVHVHNVASGRGRGDLRPHDAAQDEPRLAEPPDRGTP